MAECKEPTSSQISIAGTMDDIDRVLVDDITDDWIEWIWIIGIDDIKVLDDFTVDRISVFDDITDDML